MQAGGCADRRASTRSLLALDSRVTDCNSAFFDVANDFARLHRRMPRGAAAARIAGRHLVPRSRTRALSPRQKEEIDRVYAALRRSGRRCLCPHQPGALAGMSPAGRPRPRARSARGANERRAARATPARPARAYRILYGDIHNHNATATASARSSARSTSRARTSTSSLHRPLELARHAAMEGDRERHWIELQAPQGHWPRVQQSSPTATATGVLRLPRLRMALLAGGDQCVVFPRRSSAAASTRRSEPCDASASRGALMIPHHLAIRRQRG